jgi:2-polyprenyl-3-methyl-5-hydroxy-6-metoxy-1,4-benzoquinol methylase
MVWNMEYATRESKARKIIAILNDHLGNLNYEWTCIDVGCGSGEITSELSRYFTISIGIETKFEILKKNRQMHTASGLYFIQADGLRIPAVDESINLIICAQVYEHTSDPQKLIHEIRNKLKPNGICFFSGPNKWTLIEEHYWLPFLSWLPKRVADIYMRILKRGNEYNIKPLSYWQLRKLMTGFNVIDYSTEIMKDPDKYSIDKTSIASKIILNVPVSLLRFLTPFFPNFNWVLVKK